MKHTHRVLVPGSDAALLRKSMKEMRLKCGQLATMSGYAPDTISAYRTGRRPVPAPLWKFLVLLRAYKRLKFETRTRQQPQQESPTP